MTNDQITQYIPSFLIAILAAYKYFKCKTSLDYLSFIGFMLMVIYIEICSEFLFN